MSSQNITTFPDNIQALTADWLTDFMQAVAPGAHARGVELVDAHSGTTGRARIRIDWKSTGLPEYIFVKLAPTDPMQRVMAVDMGMGAREAHFYHDLAVELPVRLPKPIHSQWTDDAQGYIMLLEDLQSSGCTFPGPNSSADQAIAESTIEGLARLHGAFWQSPRFSADLSWIDPPMHSSLGPELIATGVQSFGAEQPDAFHEMANLYIEHSDAMAALMASGPQTLLHGDTHMGNLFFEDGKVGFLDWACVSRGPGLRDVAYFLCNSVETPLRRAEQERLIKHYLDQMAKVGAPPRDLQDTWRQYSYLSAAGWVAAAATYAVGDRMQSKEVGRTALKRSNAAVEDLETVRICREELSL